MVHQHMDNLDTGMETLLVDGHIGAVASRRRHPYMVLRQEKLHRRSRSSSDLQLVILRTVKVLRTATGVLDWAT